jgi:hypothetical protein
MMSIFCCTFSHIFAVVKARVKVYQAKHHYEFSLRTLSLQLLHPRWHFLKSCTIFPKLTFLNIDSLDHV